MAIFVSTQVQCDKILEIRGQLPGLKFIFAMDAGIRGDGVMPMADLQAKGKSSGLDAARWLAGMLNTCIQCMAFDGVGNEPPKVLMTIKGRLELKPATFVSRKVKARAARALDSVGDAKPRALTRTVFVRSKGAV